jgi:hypothetical protein
MTFKPSGATPRALFPRAWKYYDGIIASAGLIFMVANALIGLNVFSPTATRWISVGIAASTAALIWLRARAQQLGVVKVDNGHLTEESDIPKASES